jgi:hypothetical protein
MAASPQAVPRGAFLKNARSAKLYISAEAFRGLKGHESIARVYISNGSALKLTRRYLVAHCWKNTRSAGLEVLKGRQKIVFTRRCGVPIELENEGEDVEKDD